MTQCAYCVTPEANMMLSIVAFWLSTPKLSPQYFGQSLRSPILIPTHACAHTNTHAQIHTRTNTQTYTNKHTRLHTHRHTDTRTHTHTCSHRHTYNRRITFSTSRGLFVQRMDCQSVMLIGGHRNNNLSKAVILLVRSTLICTAAAVNNRTPTNV